MASTLTLRDSTHFVRPFLFFRPLHLGTNDEPALSSANLIQQTIVGPPFRWNWNRQYITFTCTAGQQDYIIPMSDFGFLEKTTVDFAGSLKEIEIRNGLSKDTILGRPRFISAQIDDNEATISSTISNVALTSNILTITTTGTFVPGQVVYFAGLSIATFLNGTTAEIITASGAGFTAAFIHADYPSAAETSGTASTGNITFRLMPVPDSPYTVISQYQRKAPLFTNLDDPWMIPDQYSYIYQHGFMSMMMQYADDPRWQVHSMKFMSHLLGAAEGLTETERNIFSSNWYAISGHTMSDAQKIQQGNQARSQ